MCMVNNFLNYPCISWCHWIYRTSKDCLPMRNDSVESLNSSKSSYPEDTAVLVIGSAKVSAHISVVQVSIQQPAHRHLETRVLTAFPGPSKPHSCFRTTGVTLSMGLETGRPVTRIPGLTWWKLSRRNYWRLPWKLALQLESRAWGVSWHSPWWYFALAH